MEIRIGKPARACTATEQPFEHGERVVSLLRIENSEYVREDFREHAWDNQRSEGAVAVWNTVFHDPKVAEQQPPEVFSPLRQVFYEHAESGTRDDLATAYLAAELLRRQKVFRLLKQADDPNDEGRVALYEDRLAHRFVEVRDPDLSFAEMNRGRVSLINRLQELEAPPETEQDDHAEPEEV